MALNVVISSMMLIITFFYTDVYGLKTTDLALLFVLVKIVGAMNYAEVFPACRAVVHHGGAGTTNAGLRAGRPTLILWMLPDQACWGSRLKKLRWAVPGASWPLPRRRWLPTCGPSSPRNTLTAPASSLPR